MESLYSKEVMKHFMNPKNMGEIENADAIGQVGNPRCGDVLKIYLKIKGNRIEDIKFQTLGCPAAIATSDALCDLAKGKTLEEAKRIDNQSIIEKLKGLPKLKLHCSVLGSNALKKAIEDYEKNSKTKNEKPDKRA